MKILIYGRSFPIKAAYSFPNLIRIFMVMMSY